MHLSLILKAVFFLFDQNIAMKLFLKEVLKLRCYSKKLLKNIHFEVDKSEWQTSSYIYLWVFCNIFHEIIYSVSLSMSRIISVASQVNILFPFEKKYIFLKIEFVIFFFHKNIENANLRSAI